LWGKIGKTWINQGIQIVREKAESPGRVMGKVVFSVSQQLSQCDYFV